jgi:hypothetical protein
MTNNLHKTASPNKYLTAALAGGGLGMLYGMGDTEHNHQNSLAHKSTGLRAAQGMLTGVGGLGGYKVMRGLGKGRLVSGLAGLLSAGGAAALANPKMPEENPYKLPF